MKFAALMYISDTVDGNSVNIGGVSSVSELISTYLKNAILLHCSLKKYTNFELVLYTNKKDVVLDFFKNYADCPIVEELVFDLNIPLNAKFYSAHFKIEVLRYLSKFPDDYSILIDLDVLLTRQLPEFIYNNIDQKLPMVYDITDMIYQTYSAEIIRRDFIILNKNVYEGRWYGGEFLGGDGVFFKKLVDKIDDILIKYTSQIQIFHHQGDEMLINAALDWYHQNGGKTIEVGQFGVIVRYWSGRTVCLQRPLNYAVQYCKFVHMPQDKKWLADLVNESCSFDFDKIFKFYGKYVFRRKLRGNVGFFVKKYLLGGHNA